MLLEGLIWKKYKYSNAWPAAACVTASSLIVRREAFDGRGVCAAWPGGAAAYEKTQKLQYRVKGTSRQRQIDTLVVFADGDKIILFDGMSEFAG